VLALAAVLTAAVAAADDVLPSLPLPDCHTNGLTPGQFVDCEGMLLGTVTFGSPPELSRPAQGSIDVITSPTTIDFRNDTDFGGEQTVTIELDLPELPEVTLPNGDTLETAVHIEWPQVYGPFNGLLACKHTGGGLSDWKIGTCDFFSPGPGQGSALFWRDTACGSTETTCSYRVIWGPYQTRVNQSMILRAKVPWYLVYARTPAGGGSDACSSLGPQGCLAGGGENWFTFAVSGPPPPLQIAASVERLGGRSFRYDGSGSGPDVVTWEWRDQGSIGPIVGTTAVVQRNFTPEEVEAIAPFGVATAGLRIVDRWNRQRLTFVPYSFLAPTGTEGPLSLAPLELVSIEDGVVTLQVVVKNVSAGPITNVFALGSEFLGEQRITVEPDSLALDPGAEGVFTLTLELGDRSSRRVQAQAFGTSDGGTVLSNQRSLEVEDDTTPGSTTTSTLSPGTTTTTLPAGGTTTLTQSVVAGDTVLEVASNDGFAAGGYATVDPGGAAEETRQIAALGSLVLAAPVAAGHDAGTVVASTPPPAGDTVGPVITVTAPAPGTVVCPDAVLLAAFTCTDAGVGVAGCGGDVTDGAALATATPGPQQAALRAWDHNGNPTEGTLTWSVRDTSGFPGVRCLLDAVDAALAAASTDDLDPKWKRKLAKAAGKLRPRVDAAEAAADARKRGKQLKRAGAIAKAFQTQVGKGVKAKKVAAVLGDLLRTRLEAARASLSALRAAG